MMFEINIQQFPVRGELVEPSNIATLRQAQGERKFLR
jgi:hypothetical protein